jgi:hypothetical protein
MTKAAKKGLDGMIRDFRREIMRLELDSKRIKKDLEKKVKKGEPKQSQRILAQNYLKKEQMINKYKGLEAKIEGVKISLANITTSQALVETMKNMGTIMKKTADSIDVNNIQKVITDFNMQLEKNEVVSELVSDAMDQDDDEIEDTDADNLIDQLAGDQKGANQLMGEQANYDDQLQGLKLD